MGVPFYLHPLAGTLFPEHIVATWAEHAPSLIVKQSAKQAGVLQSSGRPLTTVASALRYHRYRTSTHRTAPDPRQCTRSHTCLLEQSGSLENP